jgi:hypothetical protein
MRQDVMELGDNDSVSGHPHPPSNRAKAAVWHSQDFGFSRMRLGHLLTILNSGASVRIALEGNLFP